MYAIRSYYGIIGIVLCAQVHIGGLAEVAIDPTHLTAEEMPLGHLHRHALADRLDAVLGGEFRRRRHGA